MKHVQETTTPWTCCPSWINSLSISDWIWLVLVLGKSHSGADINGYNKVDVTSRCELRQPYTHSMAIYIADHTHSLNQYNCILAVLTICLSSVIMPPKHSWKWSCGGGPPPSTAMDMVEAAMPVDPDPAIDFLANIPLPVQFPTSQGTSPSHSGVATPSILPVPAAPSAPAAPAAPAMPCSSHQLASLLTSIVGGESPFTFLNKVPSPVNFHSSQDNQTADAQAADTVCLLWSVYTTHSNDATYYITHWANNTFIAHPNGGGATEATRQSTHHEDTHWWVEQLGGSQDGH